MDDEPIPRSHGCSSQLDLDQVKDQATAEVAKIDGAGVKGGPDTVLIYVAMGAPGELENSGPREQNSETYQLATFIWKR